MENKKGTGSKPAPKHKSIIAKVENACLFLSVIFISLVIAGQYLNNDRMLSAGIGIGFATLIVKVVMINDEEDR